MIPASKQALKSLTMIVYGIRHKTNDKWYIGQTRGTFNKRYSAGCFCEKTSNKLLKNACLKYGPDEFEVYILGHSFSSQDALDNCEKESIALYNTISPNGYNFESGGKRMGKTVHPDIKKISRLTRLKTLAKDRFLYDENGVKHEFTNISTFSEQNGLDSRTVSMLLSGRINRYKGWNRGDVDLRKPFHFSKEYHIVGPDGTEYRFYNGCEFARTYGLNNGSLYKVLYGSQLSHRGFHLPSPRKRKSNAVPIGSRKNAKRKYEEIVLNKDDTTYVIKDDVIEFCKIHDINKRNIYALTSGEQDIAKGFSLVSFKYTQEHLNRETKTA